MHTNRRAGQAEVLALIPARGGSKGIPRKNLLPILGRPLIAYTIEQALAASTITRVIVSTDSPEVATVARDYGAETPFLRPAELAGDLSPDVDTFRHALMWLQEHEDYRPEAVAHLRPTCPARRVEVIDRAVAALLAAVAADSLRSVAPAAHSPYKMWRIHGTYMQPIVVDETQGDSPSTPRQLLPQVWWQSGYVDVIRPRAVLEHGTMTGRRVLPFPLHEPRADLDYVEDIAAVEEALRLLRTGAFQPDSSIGEHRHAV